MPKALASGQSHYLTSLQETAVALMNRQSLPELLTAIIERAGMLVQTHHGFFCLIDSKDENMLVIEAASGVFTKRLGDRMQYGHGLGGRMWKTGKPIIIADYDTWRYRRTDFPKGLFTSAIGLPLKIGNTIKGAMVLAHTDPLKKFKDSDLANLKQFAQLASLALDNVHLYEEAKKKSTQKDDATKALKQSDERYKAFISQSTEGIWRCELEKPLSVTWSIKKQIAHIYKYGYMAECNDTMAQMYGFASSKELIGARVVDLLVPSDANNIEYLTSFITSGYKLNNRESHEVDKFGNALIFQNSLVGIVENDFLKRAWGIQQNITKQKEVERQQAFLEKISRKLVVSLDHHITLQEIALLIVPYLADYCRIAIVHPDKSIKEIIVNHKDNSKVSLAEELFDSYQHLPNVTHGIPSILASGKPEIIEKINESVLKKYKTNPHLIQIIKKIKLKSYMGVPLIAGDKVLGAITFSSSKENRYYTQEDLHFVEELARRIALTLDNIRLFREAQAELRERINLQKNLLEEQERLKLAQEAGHIGVFEWNITKNKIKWSPQLEKIYGINPETFNGTFKQWFQFIYPDDRSRVTKEFNNQIKHKTNSEIEFRIIHPDGSVHWIYSKAQVFFGTQHTPVRTVGINIDVTDRMQSQIHLRFLADASKILASSLNYETTLHNVAQIAVPAIADWCVIDMLDSHGKLQQIAVAHKNPKKVKWANELRKNYPDDQNAHEGIGGILQTGQAGLYPLITEDMLAAIAVDKRHLTLLKRVGFTSVMMVPLFSEKKTIGVITFITAETKRMYGNASLLIAQELANRASLAIENSILYKNAQHAISLRDEFISVASHELKTPLTSIKIFTQVLQKNALEHGDTKACESLGKMDKQINKLTDLIYTLLNIAKIQAGRLEFTKKEFDFDTMANEVVEILQNMTTKHKLIVKGKTNTLFFGDEDRIGQVISNLISNAIKYSPKADTVEITLSRVSGVLHVSVRDYGIGMADEHLEKIFDRFYRISGSTDRTFPGLGIGLYISNEIITRHGGKLFAKSIKGKGSIFTFTLPIK